MTLHLLSQREMDMKTSLIFFLKKEQIRIRNTFFAMSAKKENTDIARTLAVRGIKPVTEDIDFCMYYGHKATAIYLSKILEEGGQQIDIKKRCYLKADPGSCKGSFDIAYFDVEAKVCKTYRGGDVSPFYNFEACKKVCEEQRRDEDCLAERKRMILWTSPFYTFVLGNPIIVNENMDAL